MYICVGLSFLYYPVAATIYIITGIGLLLLKKIARYIALIIAIAGMIVIPFIVLLNTKLPAQPNFEMFFALVWFIVPFLVNIPIIFYLSRPQVKEQFK